MKLGSLFSYKSAFSLIKGAFILSALGSVVLSAVFGYLYLQKDKDCNERIFLLDGRGVAYSAEELLPNASTRHYEYENHLRMFYQLFFAFNKETFDTHMNRALELIDADEGRLLYAAYLDAGTESDVKSKDITATVQINKIEVLANTLPVRLRITARQRYEARGLEPQERSIDGICQVKDVARTATNPHGVQIEQFQLIATVSEE